MRKNWLNARLLVVLMALLLVVVAGCSNKDEDTSKDGAVDATKISNKDAIATVDGEKITKQELTDILIQTHGEETLNAMIDDKIVEMAVKKEKIKVTKEEIDEEYADFVENQGGEEAFKNALEQTGMTDKQFRKDITQYLSIRKLIAPMVKISDEEIKTAFEENKDALGTPEQVEASHILVEDEALAKEIAAKLKDGGDFAKLATEHSTDEGSAANGGELGLFGRGEMMPEFEEAAFSMEVGSISDLVKTDYGYHIIHLTDKKEPKEATLEDHKEEIKESLFEEKLQTEYTAWLEKAHEEYDIENKLSKPAPKADKE